VNFFIRAIKADVPTVRNHIYTKYVLECVVERFKNSDKSVYLYVSSEFQLDNIVGIVKTVSLLNDRLFVGIEFLNVNKEKLQLTKDIIYSRMFRVIPSMTGKLKNMSIDESYVEDAELSAFYISPGENQ